MLACHSKVKEEFMVLSVVNDNASGERLQVVYLRILHKFLAAFSLTIVPAF